MPHLVIATRLSPLALWQADYVSEKLEQGGSSVELNKIKSQGDKILDVALSKVGGKGLFVKELETALLNKEADLAVHSMKDVPMEFPEGLMLDVICEREDPRDAFVSDKYKEFNELPIGAIVGTSSLRRQCQLLHARPDLNIKFLRGNVGTRLQKLHDGEYDAIILAAAGLIRLKLQHEISSFLDTALCLPAAGQGAVGIEIRQGDDQTHNALAPLAHIETSIRVNAERAVNTTLNGGCQVPIAAYATISNNTLELKARVGSVDGKELLIEQANITLDENDFESNMQEAWNLGVAVANKLLSKGADRILGELLGE